MVKYWQSFSTMNTITIAIFCGSRHATPKIECAARDFGNLLATRNYRLVYGGTNAGLMKTLADSFIDAGGYAIGISIGSLVSHHPINPRCQEQILVKNLAERKAYMFAHADAAVGLPGAVGTLDEVFDAAAKAKLGEKRIRVGLLNVGGYYDPLIAMRENAHKAGLIHPNAKKLLKIHSDPIALLDELLVPF